MELNLGTNFISAIASSTTTMLSSLGGVSALIIGILFAFLVINFIIIMIEDRKWERERKQLFADSDFYE